jgi:nucleotide-binding universal stress UspA family protein
MITLKNVLVATDFSEVSEAALAYGRQIARAFGAQLHVLHVVGNVVAGVNGIEIYPTDFVAIQQEVEEGARAQLQAVVTEEDRRTLFAKTIVVTSNAAAQSIVSYAKDANIDLVVVGTHGRGGMAHLLMGSVAERVVRTAPCPVLTVRHPHKSASQETYETEVHALCG